MHPKSAAHPHDTFHLIDFENCRNKIGPNLSQIIPRKNIFLQVRLESYYFYSQRGYGLIFLAGYNLSCFLTLKFQILFFIYYYSFIIYTL